MKWFIIATLLFSFWCSCNNALNVPSSILKPEQMQVIIWDMVKADTYAEVLHQKDTINALPKISMQLNDKVFAIHNTSRLQVENSFLFYSAHPDLLKVILDSINMQQSRKDIPEPLKPAKTGRTLPN